MGYVGLPLAIAFANKGFKVTGFEKHTEKINKLKKGESYIDDIKNETLEPLTKKGKIIPTKDFKLIANQDAMLICVPTPLDKHKVPDITYIVDACKSISKYLKKNTLVILESTTYPGTTEEVVIPEIEKNGKIAGKDFFVAFSPERVDPGNKKFNTENTPKIVGGINPQSSRLAQTLYHSFLKDVKCVSSPRVAEMEKILENTFRLINISMINELAILANRMNIDIFEVIGAASTKPYGFMPFYPGPGIGGHCIPLDPFYLSWKAKEYNFNMQFIETAGQINDFMPEFTVLHASEILNTAKKSIKDAKILILGVAYKRDISDPRESPVIDVINKLEKIGAEISVSDSYISKFSVHGKEYISKELDKKLIKEQDLVIIGTDHSNVDYDLVTKNAKLILDTRNAIKTKSKNLFKLF